ncbi:hypothetical protein K438DRAFT_1940629 [Mycena galopus ATCC 62051]|nr:hypothetical protein K438DRAFT_1940629 [Mycena galopus ATCC 62051]
MIWSLDPTRHQTEIGPYIPGGLGEIIGGPFSVESSWDRKFTGGRDYAIWPEFSRSARRLVIIETPKVRLLRVRLTFRVQMTILYLLGHLKKEERNLLFEMKIQIERVGRGSRSDGKTLNPAGAKSRIFCVASKQAKTTLSNHHTSVCGTVWELRQVGTKWVTVHRVVGRWDGGRRRHPENKYQRTENSSRAMPMVIVDDNNIGSSTQVERESVLSRTKNVRCGRLSWPVAVGGERCIPKTKEEGNGRGSGFVLEFDLPFQGQGTDEAKGWNRNA